MSNGSRRNDNVRRSRQEETGEWQKSAPLQGGVPRRAAEVRAVGRSPTAVVDQGVNLRSGKNFTTSYRRAATDVSMIAPSTTHASHLRTDDLTQPEVNMSSLHRAPAVMLALALASLTSLHPVPAAAQASASVASQLGATIAQGQSAELAVGTSITGVLADPAKLAALGAPGMHAGARVTVARTSPERVRVEVDELDPAPLTKRLTLKIDSQGRLTPSTQ
jgi:hypothetical protein